MLADTAAALWYIDALSVGVAIVFIVLLLAKR